MKNNLLKNFYKILILYSFFFIPRVSAECDFKTGKYINQLSNPKSIKSLNIEIPKSRKYIKNFLEIFTYDKTSSNIRRTFIIPNKLKKKFKANIKVSYDFGNCNFKGTVRQHGDLNDHIVLKNGNPKRSLKINLKEGNILNAVNFRVLIPETRNSLNEILGGVILNELGFIAPENSEMIVTINEKKSKMIFTEDSRKEMLERRLRREGPIFTGDESLIWSEKMTEKKRVELSLSRLINHKWFLKGSNSRDITLYASSKIQELFLKQIPLIKNGNESFVINPNHSEFKSFKDFSFLLFAMNGDHGLNMHNRKFYFNSLINGFEPIYHDGNLNFRKKITKQYLDRFNLYNFDENYKFSYLELIKNNDFKKQVLESFKNRVLIFDSKEKRFFEESYESFVQNINFLQEYLNLNSHLKLANRIKKEDIKKTKQSYFSDSRKFLSNQFIITKVQSNNDHLVAYFKDNPTTIFSFEDFSKILRMKNKNDKRYIFLPDISFNLNSKNDFIQTYIPSIKGKLSHSKGMKVIIRKKNKNIIFMQTKPDDWVKISNANLDGWKVELIGLSNNDNFLKGNQRFNNYGMTGCLNIYNTKFDESFLKASLGGCEDSINIINSRGSIKEIDISNSYQDALDIDFSKIKIENALISKSGNDCIDLSSGKYKLLNGNLSNCNDKGISIGEKSELFIGDVFINYSKNAITIKDLSELTLMKGQIFNTDYCISAYQKKQEFGGGLANIKSLICDGNNYSDLKSLINI